MASPPLWIINISLAMNGVDLRKALADGLEALQVTTPAAVDDALIGYMWWRFERREIDLRECLKLIGEAADAGSSKISCESAFALLNKVESEHSDEKDVEAQAREILGPLRRLAEQQWMEIQSYV